MTRKWGGGLLRCSCYGTLVPPPTHLLPFLQPCSSKYVCNPGGPALFSITAFFLFQNVVTNTIRQQVTSELASAQFIQVAAPTNIFSFSLLSSLSDMGITIHSWFIRSPYGMATGLLSHFPSWTNTAAMNICVQVLGNVDVSSVVSNLGEGMAGSQTVNFLDNIYQTVFQQSGSSTISPLKRERMILGCSNILKGVVRYFILAHQRYAGLPQVTQQ